MGDDEPIFEYEAQINTVLGAVMIHYNTLIRDIDRSLERLEVDRIVDYRPLFLSGDQKPTHDAVRAWVRGFWKAMALAPETWSKLAEDERTRIIIAPFVGFFDLGHLAPHKSPSHRRQARRGRCLDPAHDPRPAQARPYPRSRQPPGTAPPPEQSRP